MEEEILQEIEAVKVVYGSYCNVLEEIPPHLKVSLKSRTAKYLSQQVNRPISIFFEDHRSEYCPFP